MARMGGQQISSLLESLPGIASVLRSPVADAIAGMIRAGAGLGEFRQAEARELVQYAVRRGLLGAEEGEELLAEIKGRGKKGRAARPVRKAPKKTATKRPAATGAKKTTAKAKKVAGVKKTTKATAVKRTSKKVAKKKAQATKKPKAARKR